MFIKKNTVQKQEFNQNHIAIVAYFQFQVDMGLLFGHTPDKSHFTISSHSPILLTTKV